MMGGLDWAAIPIAFDVLGIRDPELIIAGLVAIRDYFDAKDRQPYLNR